MWIINHQTRPASRIQNNSAHSFIGATPFKVTQGSEGELVPGLGTIDGIVDGNLKAWWIRIVKTWGVVEQELKKAKEDYKNMQI